MERARRMERARTRIKQKLLGALLLALCGLIIWLDASGSAAAADRDGTAVLLFAPLGLYMLFSRRIIING